MNPTTDRTAVRASYTRPASLGARASIYHHRRDRSGDFLTTIAQLIDIQRGDTLLDIGCGSAPYFTPLDANGPSLMVGVDASAEMLHQAQHRHDHTASRIGFVQGLLDALPLRLHRWDVVLAAHSLYHADDPAQVLTGLPNLLRPGGALYIVLNGHDHLQEIRTIARRAGHPGLLQESARLTAEDAIAALDSGHDLAVTWFDDELDIPASDPVLAYIDSTRAMYEPQVPSPLTWETVLDAAARLVNDQITHSGSFRARTRTALIRCG